MKGITYEIAFSLENECTSL